MRKWQVHLGVFTLLAAANGVTIAYYFGYSFQFLPWHILFSFLLFLVSLSGIKALAQRTSAWQDVWRWAMLCFLWMTFALTWVSHHCWGQYLSLRLLAGGCFEPGLLQQWVWNWSPLAWAGVGLSALVYGLTGYGLGRFSFLVYPTPAWKWIGGAGVVVGVILLFREEVAQQTFSLGEPYTNLIRTRTPRAVLGGAAGFANAQADFVARKQLSDAPSLKTTAPHLILLVVDALRADRARLPGRYLPQLSRWAQSHQGKSVEAVAPFSSTYGSISTLLHSRVDATERLRPVSLLEVAQASGYRNVMILSGERKRWHYLWPHDQAIVDFWFSGEDEEGYAFYDDRLLLEGLKKAQLDPQLPTFLYLHFLSAHSISPVRPEFQVALPAKRITPFLENNFVPSSVPAVKNSYHNGLLQADDMMVKTLQYLEKKGMLEQAILLILSDHGESLGEHQTFGHRHELYQPLLDVPFLIFDDPTLAYRNLDHASLIDVAPTLLERAGLPIPATWEGRSLLSQPPAPYTFHQTEEARPDFAVIAYTDSARIKYLLRQPPGQPAREYLFNLSRDPAEAQNLLPHPAYQATLDSLRTLARQKFSRFPLPD